MLVIMFSDTAFAAGMSGYEPICMQSEALARLIGLGKGSRSKQGIIMLEAAVGLGICMPAVTGDSLFSGNKKLVALTLLNSFHKKSKILLVMGASPLWAGLLGSSS